MDEKFTEQELGMHPEGLREFMDDVLDIFCQQKSW